MIPAKITDEVYNNLEWKEVETQSLYKELEGLTVIGAETCLAWTMPNGREAVDGVALFLQAPEEDRIKVVFIDADYTRPVDKEDVSPITIAVAYA